VASEDSDQVASGFLAVHRLRNHRNLEHTFRLQMVPLFNHLEAQRELLEVELLRAAHRVGDEEWDDRFEQVSSTIDDVLPEVLTVIVVASVLVEPAHAEEALQLLQASQALSALRHDESMRHLIAGSVALPVHAARLPHEPDREAAFSIYKTDDPPSPDQPFLLIVRITRHVVTIVNARSDGTMSSAGYPEFPAYGRLHRRNRFRRGLAIEP
jgi:hypothetical protein